MICTCVLVYRYKKYFKVKIICRYIFLRFWLIAPFASTNFCDLHKKMVQGRPVVMFYSTIVLLANDCGYKTLCFWANLQKYLTLVPAKKNSHLKVIAFQCVTDRHTYIHYIETQAEIHARFNASC